MNKYRLLRLITHKRGMNRMTNDKGKEQMLMGMGKARPCGMKIRHGVTENPIPTWSHRGKLSNA